MDIFSKFCHFSSNTLSFLSFPSICQLFAPSIPSIALSSSLSCDSSCQNASLLTSLLAPASFSSSSGFLFPIFCIDSSAGYFITCGCAPCYAFFHQILRYYCNLACIYSNTRSYTCRSHQENRGGFATSSRSISRVENQPGERSMD